MDVRREIDIVVPERKTKERIDRFLTNCIENASRSKVQAAIKAGFVLVNGKATKASHIVAPGEHIHVIIPRSPQPAATPENIPLNILYEDDHLLVVNKPAGMVTHPAYGNYTGTLVNALLYHCNSLSTVNDELRPGIVHRLDKGTSGLLVVAKDDATHRQLAEQFSSRTIERDYWAVVWGHFAEDQRREQEIHGTIEAELGRSKSDRKKFAVVREGKPAVTEYRILRRFSAGLSLITLKLRTGRTHQIRVHLAHIRHPVFGDPTYGGRRIAYGETTQKRKARIANLLKIMPRQALHAKTLGFIHPVTKEFMRFDSDLPEDMQMLLGVLSGRNDVGE